MAPAAATAPAPVPDPLRLQDDGGPPRPAHGLGLLAAVIVPVLFGMLANEVREGETQHFDDALRMTVYGVASPRATAVLHAITQLGSPLFLIPMTMIPRWCSCTCGASGGPSCSRRPCSASPC